MTRLVTLTLLSALVFSACTGGEDEPQAGAGPSTPSVSTSPTPSDAEASPSPSRPERERRAAVAATFFGVHDGRVSQGIAPDAPVGSLRFWDSGTSWLHLETSPGLFDWAPLDTAVQTAEAAGARPLLVLGQTPVFHASKPGQEAPYGPGAASMPDLGAWRRYVTAVALRYRNRIDYQVWNETNVVQYWAGTPRQMAELTLEASDAIRQVAPRATVIAPPFALRLPSQQRYFADFWALQSADVDLEAAVDAAAVHLYPPAEEPPEAQVELFDYARGVLEDEGIELSVWNTEINFGLLGGPEPPPIPAAQQRAFLMRAYLLNAGLGVERVYWYSWNIGRIANTYVTEEDLITETAAGRSFDVVRAWLEGTQVEGCEPSDGVWECTARKGGETRTFWWKPVGAATRLPAVEGAVSWTDADGDVTRCRGACQVPVGETPVMVVSR